MATAYVPVWQNLLDKQLSSWVGGNFKFDQSECCAALRSCKSRHHQTTRSRWWFTCNYCPHQRRNCCICRGHNWIHGICQSSKKNCQIWLIFQEVLRSNQAIKSLTIKIKKFLNLILHQYLTAAGKSFLHEKIPWIPNLYKLWLPKQLHQITWKITCTSH